MSPAFRFGSISFFAISLVLIYLYSYTRDFKKEDYTDSQSLIGKYVIYIITLTYAGYLMFSPFSFYRLATLLPFLYIVLVQNKNMVLYNGIFDIAAQFGLMMKLILRGSRLFEVRFVNKALIQRFFGYNVEYKASCPYSSVDLYLYDNKDLLEHYQPLFSGVAVVSMAMLLILNHPEKYDAYIGLSFFEVDIEVLKGLKVHTHLTAYGRQYSRTTNFFTNEITEHELPGRVIVDLGVNYNYKNFGIGLNCHNLLNTKYEQGGVSTGFIRQQGRWLMAEVSYKF